MASSAAPARSTGQTPLQMTVLRHMGRVGSAVERWLEAERDQLPLWVPVLVGFGIAAWFWLPDPARWGGFILAMLKAVKSATFTAARPSYAHVL